MLLPFIRVVTYYSPSYRSANQYDPDNKNKLYSFFILAETVLRQIFINSGYKGRETPYSRRLSEPFLASFKVRKGLVGLNGCSRVLIAGSLALCISVEPCLP